MLFGKKIIVKDMSNTRRIIFLFIFMIVSVFCFSQNQDGLGWYTARINGKELAIHLVSDSTYEAETLWGPSHGFYEIMTNKEPSFYDRIIFGDMVYDTKNAFYFYHIPIPQEVAKTLVDSNLYNKDSFYVAMCDLTGEFVTYHDVCFEDTTGNLLLCDYNERGGKAHIIPSWTSSIGMTGEQFNYTTYFKSEYDRTQGSIVYVIGPSPDRFLIKKDKSCILYRPCHCDDLSSESDCCVAFIKEQ